MKKKLLSLLVICIMVLSSFTVSFAAEEAPAPSVKDEDLTPVSGADAIANIGKEGFIFLDLRAAADFAGGHMKNTVSAPVCNADYSVPLTNKTAFIEQMQALNVDSYSTIYLSCYMGTFCVNYAADWLLETYGDAIESKLVRVSGGTFTDLALDSASRYTDPEVALNADAIILDVRATDKYWSTDFGYMDGALHQPLFADGTGDVTDGSDKLAQDFSAFVEANKALLSSKKIYILCNGGARGAAAATTLLEKAGIVKTGADKNVFTIEGGAGVLYGTEGVFTTQNFVPGADALADTNGVIVNVRTPENYGKGHVKGAINIPVFSSTGVTNGYDDVAKAFLSSVAVNAEKLAGKNIYLVCNSGASGAKAATKLLMQAGYSNANIFTISGGAKGTAEDMSVPNNSTYVSADQAVSVLGNDAYVIIDVRASETCKANGQLKGAVQQPLFVIGADGKPALTGNEKEIEAFNAYVEANKATLAGKTIYILCNSGSRGAAKAIELLAAKGITNVFTIEGGATNQAIKDAFAGNTPAPAPQPSKPTSPVTGETLSTGYILLMLALVLAFVSKKRFA